LNDVIANGHFMVAKYKKYVKKKHNV